MVTASSFSALLRFTVFSRLWRSSCVWITALFALTVALAAGNADHGSEDDATAASDAQANEKGDAQQHGSGEKLEMPPPLHEDGIYRVFVVPIEGPITQPQFFLLRRALKEAIEEQVDVVILNMDTPGGELGTTLEMMEALSKFSGTTVTFVNDEAISAGSYIAISTDYIFFAPGGIMGAAEAVMGTGEDIAAGMQRKINSYLRAKVRTLSDQHRYRADVQRAMMDPDFEFIIDGEVLKAPGELLTLTATEATRLYGEPPVPLLAEAIVPSIEDLLEHLFGPDAYELRNFEVTWSEKFALWFKGIAPILLGVGLLMLFIEFKTPSFGVIGGIGIALLLLVFASNYFAGLAGNEEILVFILGVILLTVEVFVVPGTMVAGVLGLVLIVGSLLWAMADVWPTEDFSISADLFYVPLMQVAIGFIIAFVLAGLLMRYLPGGGLFQRLVLTGDVSGPLPATDPADLSQPAQRLPAGSLPAPGARGIAVSPLRPQGQIEIDGQRFPARLDHGTAPRGVSVEVTGHGDFSVLVKRQ